MIDATRAAAGVAPKARGRPGRWKAIFVTALVLGVFGTSAWVVFESRVFVVRQVVVTGTHLVPKSQVIAATGVRVGGSMIKLDTGTVADRVAGIQQIESVRVERRWPTTLRIEVRERVPAVVAVRGRRYYQIDRFGGTVLTTSARPRGLPELAVGAPNPGDPATAAALAVWRGLPERFRRRVAAIGATDPEEVTLRLKTGISVIWGAPERAAEKLRLVEALAATATGRSAHTIDVSSPEVVTTR